MNIFFVFGYYLILYKILNYLNIKMYLCYNFLSFKKISYFYPFKDILVKICLNFILFKINKCK